MHPTLSSAEYYSPDRYRSEIAAIWQREWLCVGRETDWEQVGAYSIVKIDAQEVVVTRNRDRELRAFFNTCRHRGSQLCTTETGQFTAGRIVCPYHAWAYDLDGRLVATPNQVGEVNLDRNEFGLYPVALSVWRGFVFVNLAEQPVDSLTESLGDEAETLASWPLENLSVALREQHVIRCNWKLFWENFLECYHCPGIHTELCKLVPMYGHGITSKSAIPADFPEDFRRRRLREGAVTWSADGQTPLPWFDGLSEQEQGAGMTYLTHLPSVFIVAHVDYVRSVRVMPLGPEETRLTVDWLLAPEVLGTGSVDIERMACFGRQVVLEDAAICETNQRGLHCQRHDHGVLTPGEEDVLWFHNWLRKRISGPE
jgi:Rieske 2Fe-2S family protein